MQGLDELLVILVFIGAVVVQYLLKRRARRAPAPPVPAEGLPPKREAAPADLAGLEQRIPQLWPPRTAVEAAPRREAPAAGGAPAPRRFSKASLFASRRDVQDAVVIATILGPCRALEPKGDEPPPLAPRRRSRPRTRDGGPAWRGSEVGP